MTVLTCAMLTAAALAGVAAGSVHPADALEIHGLLLEHTGEDPLVTLAGPDSAIVLFVVMGGEWMDDGVQWGQLLTAASVAVRMDTGREWRLRDVAVSFGDAWCRMSSEHAGSIASAGPDAALRPEVCRSLVEVRILE
ncbi:MAG: hypothetical protein AVO35_06645 [Candidatus Aegiribacteria sp. MLS_C]|nr:MAG: hypothetical protein AVO35_06645 [Candidatus Aegiribacteria sp. MLS_C]